MKHYVIAVLALSTGMGLALSLPAAAEKAKGPCAADAAKFCKDVKPGEGRIAACLKEHEKELSQACTDRKAKATQKRGKRGDRLSRKGGKSGGNACLQEYGDGFARGFQKGLKMRQGPGSAKAKKGRNDKVCAADVKKFCGDVKPGEGSVRDCLIKNASKLSDGCKTRTEKVKARMEKKEKKA
jgi:hypothetical protein